VYAVVRLHSTSVSPTNYFPSGYHPRCSVVQVRFVTEFRNRPLRVDVAVVEKRDLRERERSENRRKRKSGRVRQKEAPPREQRVIEAI